MPEIAPGDLTFVAGTTSYNLESDDTCDLTTGAPSNDLVDTDPMLGTLGSYGGETRTINLLAGSLALNRVPRTPTDACDPTVNDTFPPAGGNNTPVDGMDQRGTARPAAPSGLCEVGAFDDGTSPAADPPTVIPTAPPTTVPVDDFDLRAAIKRCKKKYEKGSDACKNCIKKAKKKDQSD